MWTQEEEESQELKSFFSLALLATFKACAVPAYDVVDSNRPYIMNHGHNRRGRREEENKVTGGERAV